MEETFDHSRVPLARLLAHRDWVTRVARVLASGAAADDLEQEVWLRAIERPPRHAGGLRGWLATLLRHGARDAARGESRRQAREARVATGEARAGADLVAEADTHRRVVDAVMELREPYRTTVLLRYYEDLGPTEIARRQGVPVETVRTRLRRAHERLAERLGGDAGRGDGPNLFRALAPLLLAPTPGKGVVLMTAKGKVGIGAAALLFLATATVMLLPREAPPDRPPAPATTLVARPPVRPANESAEAAPKVPDTEPWPEKGIDVLVVDAEDRPLPGVVVHYALDPFQWPGWKALMAGPGYLTDGAGRGRVPVPRSGAYIGVRTGEGDGRAKVSWHSAEPVILHVAPERWVRVKVRVDDDRGKPAKGVTVVLGRIDGEGRAREVVRADTASDGQALLEVEEVDIRHIEGLPSLVVDAVVPQDGPIRGKVTPAILDGEEMLLALPPTGSVRVRVLAPDGSPAKPPVRARISAPHWKPGPVDQPEAWVPLGEDGTAFFPRVTSGGRIAVSASDRWHSYRSSSVLVDAPAPGKTIDVTVKLRWDEPTILGRIVDRNGKPVTEKAFHGEVQRASGWEMVSGPFETDAAGRFQIRLSRPGSAPLVIRAFPTTGPPDRVAVISVDAPLSVEGLDVGDVRLEDAPLLAAGVVEDPEGRPLPGIQVFPAADAGYSTFGRSCRTDAEGRFRLYGNWMTPDVRVCTSSYDWLRRESGGVVVPAGSTGNRIVCTRAARIEVTLEVDARFENAPFDFRLGSADDDRRWLVLVRWRDDRHAVITTDATGTVDLDVLGLRDGPVLATVGGIAVEPGQTVEREIDLRGKLLAYAFHLTDGKAGIRSSRAEFRFVYEGKPGLRALNADFSDGFLRFLAPTPEVEISVRLEGYRTLVRKVTPADREIALEPVFRVEFRLDPTAAAPTEHLRLVPVLTPLDGEGEAHPIDLGSAWYYKGAYWAPHGLVVRAGRYRVAYHLRPASGKGAGVAIGHVEPSEIEVKDRPTTQTFPVRITWRDLAAAQAGLR